MKWNDEDDAMDEESSGWTPSSGLRIPANNEKINKEQLFKK